MREKVIATRVRIARRRVADGSQLPGGWADTYAKDVGTLKRLLVKFVVADAARAIGMNDYPGLTKAEKALFLTRLEAQRWLGAMLPWDGPR